MVITEVKVFPVEEDKLKAFVSIVIDHCFMVNDVKVIQGKDGLFISMPSRRKKNGEFKDVAHPLNNECRRMLETRILAEYGRVRGLPEGQVVAAAPVVNGESRADGRANGHAGHPADGTARGGTGSAPAGGERERATLDEVEDFHLRDSFWSLS